VAGDQLKAASTLGVPVIGVGLLYQQGYFRQEIDAQGHQQALYPFNDPGLTYLPALGIYMSASMIFRGIGRILARTLTRSSWLDYRRAITS
jgi:amino acid permease